MQCSVDLLYILWCVTEFIFRLFFCRLSDCSTVPLEISCFSWNLATEENNSELELDTFTTHNINVTELKYELCGRTEESRRCRWIFFCSTFYIKLPKFIFFSALRFRKTISEIGKFNDVLCHLKIHQLERFPFC